jgi:hypothetical protein
MSIQANINQLLTMAAIGAKFIPGSEEKFAARKAEKGIRILEKEEKVLGEKTDMSDVDVARSHEILGEKTALRKKAYEAAPTGKRYEEYRKARGFSETTVTPEYEPEEIAFIKAQKQREAKEQIEHDRLAQSREDIRNKLLDWRNK